MSISERRGRMKTTMTKRLIVLFLNWMALASFLVAWISFANRSILVGIILGLLWYGLCKFQGLVKECWDIPKSGWEIFWDKWERKRRVEDDNSKNSEEKERLTKAIDDEEQPIDMLTTLLSDSVYFLLAGLWMIERLLPILKSVRSMFS